jgi:hypothetical protein
MLVTLKINGQEIHCETDNFHESWIAKCLAYGVRRLPNDSYSGEKGATKYDLVKALVGDMMSGKPAPERVKGTGRSSGDPVEALAYKNAKADLTAMFRKVTGFTKAADFATHEKVAPFFTTHTSEGGTVSTVWNMDNVAAWMTKQFEAGKRDYMGDAKATIEAVDTVEDDLEF